MSLLVGDWWYNNRWINLPPPGGSTFPVCGVSWAIFPKTFKRTVRSQNVVTFRKFCKIWIAKECICIIRRLKNLKGLNLVYFKEVFVKLAHLTPFSPTDVVPALSSLAIGDANAVGETGSRRKVASPSEERRLDSGRAIMHAGGDSVKAATCKHEHLEQVWSVKFSSCTALSCWYWS